jgi:hypothetical protein
LALWRNKNAWRGLSKDFVLDNIKEFWDGEKFREDLTSIEFGLKSIQVASNAIQYFHFFSSLIVDS